MLATTNMLANPPAVYPGFTICVIVIATSRISIVTTIASPSLFLIFEYGLGEAIEMFESVS
ncbi:hypothetical protein GCM10009000_124730 [Halobacterium noricense]